MSMLVPTPQVAARIAEEFAVNPLTIEDLCDQVLTRMEIEDVICGRREVTPRRIVRTIWNVTAARRRNGLRPYPETVIHAVVWLLAPKP